jgi:hypothetical protein
MLLVFVHQFDFALQLFVFKVFAFEIELDGPFQCRLTDVAFIKTAFDQYPGSR